MIGPILYFLHLTSLLPCLIYEGLKKHCEHVQVPRVGLVVLLERGVDPYLLDPVVNVGHGDGLHAVRLEPRVEHVNKLVLLERGQVLAPLQGRAKQS
jgi:hypothetical protein